MSPEKKEPGRHDTSLLYINTVLTALILPLLAFVGVRLWDRVDSNARDLNTLSLELSIVKERQQRVLENLPKLYDADERLRTLLEEHLRKSGVTTPTTQP